jgi:hypothetical protein
MAQDVAQAPEHLRSLGWGKAPFHQEQRPFLLVLAAPHLNPRRFSRGPQMIGKVSQEAVTVKIPAGFKGKIIWAQHRVEHEFIVVRPLIRGMG